MNNMSLIESKASATAFAKEESNLRDLQSISSVLYPRFTVLELLDESETSAVFLAQDERARAEGRDLLVKLKVLSEQARLDRKKLELFYLEASAAAKLSHRNIIKTSEAEQVGNLHFCAIEHRPGCESLRNLLDLKAWLDTQLAAAITLQIAEALDYAYRQGVMHLNLQPRSILIDAEGTALITDFGIEKRDELRWAHQARAQNMPVFYCSPEQASGQDVDVQSDLYSLGIILYEMLTDRLPFDYQNTDVVLHKHRTQTPEPPGVFRSDLPAAISAVVMSLLEKQPIKRPQLPAHLQAALNGIIQKQETPLRSLDVPVLNLEIDDDIISGEAVDEDETEGSEWLGGWDDFAHTKDASILEPVEREPVESSLPRREPFEPPTITVIEPPLHELVEHGPLIETPAKVIASQPASPAVAGRYVPAEMRTKLFLILLIIIVAALALTLFDSGASLMPFRNKAATHPPPEEATKEGSTEAAQPAKPVLNEIEDRAPLNNDAVPTRSEKPVWNRSSRVRTPRRTVPRYSKARTAQRRFKSNVAARPAKRARIRARYN